MSFRFGHCRSDTSAVMSLSSRLSTLKARLISGEPMSAAAKPPASRTATSTVFIASKTAVSNFPRRYSAQMSSRIEGRSMSLARRRALAARCGFGIPAREISEFASLGPFPIALIVIPIRERHSWNVIGNKPNAHSEWQSGMGFFQTMRHWRCGRLLNYVRFSKEGLGGE